nr:hypothetical protein [uncultured Halomonas sp.]
MESTRSRDVEGLRVPFGLKDGRLYPPNQVENGLSCGCQCPGCDSQLIANHPKSGTKRSYFSHYRASPCPGGYETAVHWMAKQIIEEAGLMTLPAKTVHVSVEIPSGAPIQGEVPFPPHEATLTEIVQEQAAERWRPDLTATLKNGAMLYIEVRVTHAVEEPKAKSLDNLMEIDLSDLSPEEAINPEALKKAVLCDARRTWFRCSLYDELPPVERKRSELEASIPDVLEHRRRDAQQEVKERERQARRQRALEKQQQALEEKRATYRAQYADQLEQLRLMGEPERQMAREQERSQNRAVEKIRYRALAEPGTLQAGGGWPRFIGLQVYGDWIFNARTDAWQALLVMDVILRKTPGTVVTPHECVKAIREYFGILPWMEKLARLKSAQKRQGRERGKAYADFGAWFLTNDENRAIVSPYYVVIQYLKALARGGYGLISTRPSDKDRDFIVACRSVETLLARNQQRHDQPATVTTPLRTGHRPMHSASLLPPPEPWPKQEQRCLDRMDELVAHGVHEARLCSFCHMPHEPLDTDICPDCQKGRLQPLVLSKPYVQRFPELLRIMPRRPV